MVSTTLPSDVAGDEKIVRTVKVPAHYDLKKRRLKPAAFRPAPGSSAVSVIRLLMGSDFCKNKSREIARDSYLGMGVLVAADARATGVEVLDWPADFHGHAHIDHGDLVPPPNDPLPPDLNEAFLERLRSLVAVTAFHGDPSPDTPGWDGPPL